MNVSVKANNNQASNKTDIDSMSCDMCNKCTPRIACDARCRIALESIRW